uniref:CSON010448 protein n=1 Tax=Culicoides sonorensis TaxID=179676 RepID=A0A336M2C1_CULSO
MFKYQDILKANMQFKWIQVKTLIVIILYINGACVLCAVIKIEKFCSDMKLNGALGEKGSILKLECEKLAQEKTEMQRHYVMRYC